MKQKRKHRLGVLCAALAVLLALGFVYREPIRMIWYSNVDPEQPLHVEGWTGGKIYQNVPYSAVSASDYLNLYVPDAQTPPPLLVLVHGGGFVLNDCESRQAQLFYQYFREHGWACATVNYRLAQEAVFPAALEDVKCAIRFLRANADHYGYDAEKIAVWGESAGGYLAVMAGVTTDAEFNSLPFIGETEPVSAAVDAVVDYYGAVILETKEERHAAFRALGVPAFVVDIALGWLRDATKDLPWASNCEDAWIGRPIAALSAEERQRIQPLYYADAVLGQGNAADGAGSVNAVWNYADEVSYPFGYGLSYTTFEQTLKSVDLTLGGAGRAVVTVKNTGDVAGKSVVQLYVQAPYKQGGLEKSAIQLVAFEKTSLLAPGASEDVTVEFDPAYFASYDENAVKANGTQGAWVLEDGDYYFAVGNGAHEALNNVLAKKTGSTEGLVSTADTEDINPDNAVVWKLAATDMETYSVGVQNQLQDTAATPSASASGTRAR